MNVRERIEGRRCGMCVECVEEEEDDEDEDEDEEEE